MTDALLAFTVVIIWAMMLGEFLSIAGVSL